MDQQSTEQAIRHLRTAVQQLIHVQGAMMQQLVLEGVVADPTRAAALMKQTGMKIEDPELRDIWVNYADKITAAKAD